MQRAATALHRQPAQEADADGFADDQTGDDAKCERIRQHIHHISANGNTRIGEREERQNEPHLDRVEDVLEHQTRGEEIDCTLANVFDRVKVVFVCYQVVVGRFCGVDVVQKGFSPGDELGDADARFDRDDKGDKYTRHRRVNSRCEDCQPDTNYERQQDAKVLDSRPNGNEKRDQQYSGDNQGADPDLLSVEEGDHGNRSEVISDRERGQKDLETERRLFAEHREHPKREGDVGRHRDAPTPRALATEVERNKEHRRHHHSPDGCSYRERRLVER